MNKVTKIFIVAACFVALVAGVLLLPVTREFAARWALEWLAGKLDARAGFERVSIGWRGDVRFDELYFVDNQGDTILRGDVGVGFKLGRRVEVRRVAVSDGWADISLIVSRLRGNGGAKIAAIELRRMNVVYDTLRADRVGLNVRDFVADNGDISLNLKKLRFNYREHSVEVSVPRLAVEKKILTADGACVSIDDSRLFFEKFRYNFPAKKFETAIENSAVKLCGITFNNLNISAFGTMDDISAQVAFSSKEAVLRASGRLRPREKSFDVRVDSLAADARIVDIFVRKPLSDTLQTMLGRLGHVSLKGDFGGRNGDFKVDATVSTSLGLVNLTGLFSGDYKSQADVTIEQFDLGHLFMIKDLGRATASARIYGRTAEIKINNIDYKAYDYQHITARIEKKNGDLSVQAVSNDPALSAIFDLEGRNFALNVARADLRAMNFDRRGKPSVLGFAAHGTLGRMMRAEFDNIRYINHLDTISVRKTSLFRSGERLEISSDMSLLGALVPGLRSTGNSSFTFTKNRGEAEFFLRAQRLERGDGVLQNLRIDGVMHTDTIALDGGFDIGQQRWALASKEIVFRDKSFIINDFALDGSGQKIRVNGVASSNRVDTLNIGVENFDLTPLSDIVRTGHKISGEASGRAILTSAFRRPTVMVAMALDSMKIDHVELPNLDFSTSWEGENLRLLLNEAGGKTLVTATYSPSDRRMEGRVDMKNIDLSLLDTHYKRTMSATRGRADLVATLSEGKISGDILVHDYSALVDFLGVRYSAAPQTRLKIEDNVLRIDSVSIADPENNLAVLTAGIDLRNPKNVGYEFDISTPNSLVLNTSHTDNSQFYGRIFASAIARITGSKEQGTDLMVNAATLPGSRFFMPLNDKHDIAEAEYLTFVDPSVAASSSQMRHTRRLSADVSLQIESNTPVELLIDPRTGHRIRTRGNGLLNLHVAPREDEFTIYGDYRIDEGTYLFSIENIIEKPFVITPGSIIQWMGDPRDALLNISATYDLKTSITPAMQGTGFDTWRARVPVECRLLLTDRLSAPTLTFDITAPQATPETQTMLRNFLSTEEMTATQFFFLLATGNFYDSETAANIGAAAGTTTAFDFLSSQISNLIPSENFDIGIRYRPQTETTSDEWGVDFSQQLWGERLLLEIEGNYDTRNNRGAVYTENQNNFTGDFNLTGIINRRGTLRAKAFTRTITRFDENQGLQESGVGIYFTEEFNTFGEIFRRHKSSATKRTDN